VNTRRTASSTGCLKSVPKRSANSIAQNARTAASRILTSNSPPLRLVSPRGQALFPGEIPTTFHSQFVHLRACSHCSPVLRSFCISLRFSYSYIDYG
jgi:hypothetical protein